MMAGRMSTYTVFVDDNYHLADESDRYKLGEFADCASAIASCQEIVNEYFATRSTGTPRELLLSYYRFGKNPWISSDDPDCTFSAWTYAKQRCVELESQSPAVYTVLVDDNDDPMDGFTRYKLGDFPNCTTAMEACKSIVDEFFITPGTDTAAEMLDAYRRYGKNPFILSGDTTCVFSAWKYAEQRCHEIVAEREG